jgi:hypothetical protein
MKTLDLQKIPFWWLLLAAMTLNILAQAIHEGGHWAVFQVTGHRPVWAFTSIAQVWDTPPLNPAGWEAITAPDGEKGWRKLSSAPGRTINAIDNAAGPLAALVSVVAGLLLYRFSKKTAVRLSGLILTLITGLLMTFYYARSGTRTGGDEGFLAAFLGLPKIVFDIPFGLAFFTCLLLGLGELKTWKNGLKVMGVLVLGMLLSAGPMVLVDPFIQAGVNADNPFFRPMLGFSLPVFLTYCLAILGLILLGKNLTTMEKKTADGQSKPA